MRNVSFFIGSAFALSLLALAASPAPASAAEEIVLSPDHAPAGSKIQLSLCDFPGSDAKDAAFSVAFEGKTIVKSVPAGRCGGGAGVGGKSGVAPIYLVLDGAPGPHKLVITFTSSASKPYSASQIYTIDETAFPPLKTAQPRPPGPPGLPTPGPIRASADIPNVVTPGAIDLLNPVTIHIDGVTPSPGRPDQTTSVAFTVTNNTANDADVDVTGHSGPNALGGRGRHLRVPAHSSVSSSLVTYNNAASGEVLVHASLLGGLHVVIGRDGLPHSEPSMLGEATDTANLDVQVGCTSRGVDPATYASIINIVEGLDAPLPEPFASQYAASGHTFRTIFGRANRLDIAQFITNPPAWQANFINQTWISRNGGSTTGLSGNSIFFRQSFTVHLDTVHMTWGARLALTGDPSYDGNAFHVRTSSAHLDLDIPPGDLLLVGAAAAGIAIPDPIIAGAAVAGAREALRTQLETMASEQVGSQLDAAFEALLGNSFHPQDDFGRSRSAMSFAAPNIVMSYCFPGSR